MNMKDEERCGPDIFGTPNLNEIKESPDILEKIKWDVTPQMVMEPRFQSRAEDLQKLREISGYMFYVESQCEPPALMLLKVGKTDITSTVGRIDEVPVELVRRAIEHPREKPAYGMYAITDEIKEWLKKELGL
ncbi:MAG: hypothetical protein M1497_02125 [Nitrospirae bacterium]|nr:hypothetical protein [Nitrospirota bacterium]